MLINARDAAARGITDGDLVELSNARGRCLAGARVSEDIAEGTVFLWTGAWYDPDKDGHCQHGNPNVLTHDERTSEWGQGPAAHSTRVQIRRLEAKGVYAPPHRPPNLQNSQKM